MLGYKNIVITSTSEKHGYYDEKKKKHIEYKKPKTTTKVIYEDDYCCDYGELYEIIKFHTDKQGHFGNDVKVTFEPYIEY